MWRLLKLFLGIIRRSSGALVFWIRQADHTVVVIVAGENTRKIDGQASEEREFILRSGGVRKIETGDTQAYEANVDTKFDVRIEQTSFQRRTGGFLPRKQTIEEPIVIEEEVPVDHSDGTGMEVTDSETVVAEQEGEALEGEEVVIHGGGEVMAPFDEESGKIEEVVSEDTVEEDERGIFGNLFD
ncbi:hypothetical protein AWC38_SpisGene25442 [Stylophora pistillata]|uniref:Uncharacterized protein n=1 Tax=Stylophora pistillata TaxID=50429 RepID=A0A2B4R3W5_STYPI|nr:hypothetical protein AWC38_SpisGene25442 [Stylophora pistillata]